MTLTAPPRCSALAAELEEPLAGTVEHRVRWLLVEDRSGWGQDAVGDVLGPRLAGLGKSRGVRVLLVRRREGDPASDVSRRAFLVDTATRQMATRTVADLADLTPELVADGAVGDFGDPHTEPIFLVCTNGKRDACCALRGRALVAAVAAAHPERTWECTHLGGHRFAANLVCLPDGIVYGRVLPDDGPRLVDAYRSGRVDPVHLRGRSAWPAPAQAAEVELRQRLGLEGLDDLRLVTVEVEENRATVAIEAGDGTGHRLTMRAERLAPPRSISCRADELEEPIHWRVG